jgi:hypothetical protein
MTSDVQGDDEPIEPARWLLDVTAAVAPGWLRRVTLAAAARGGVSIAPDDAEMAAVVDAACERLVAQLSELLAADVDDQRTNPLSLFRDAVAAPTQLLLERGVRPPATDRFTADHFPDDVFGLGPATWSDVDPELHEPGLTWGAWKAMTVLHRRRDEGLR